MYRYVVLLYLLHACCLSLPAPENETLAKILTGLANDCKSQQLADLIRSKVEDCNVEAPKDEQSYKEKQLECLMFYDMNKQLCTAAINEKLLSIELDIKSHVNKVQDVNMLCGAAHSWKFDSLMGYPHYQSVAKKGFEKPIKCLKICMADTDDVNADQNVVDSKFFCKFYKWGSEMLNPEFLPSGSTKSQNIMPAPAVPTTNNASNIGSQDVEVRVPVSSTAKNQVENHVSVQNEPEKPAIELNPQSNPETDKNTISHTNFDAKKEEDQLETKSKAKEPMKNEEKLSMDGEEPPKKEDVDNDQVQDPNDKKNVVIENPKAKINPEDDYQGGDIDSEEGKDGPDTKGGDDGVDPMLLEDAIPDPDQGKLTIKKRIQSSVSIYNGDTPKEFLPNPIPDGFTDDDDHFFPFFLTAVILIVLVYVLYHNKSKVSKLFLGLIVEGRQTSRRRNSRGHAYRRLDTLEQAMSANTAAPPSKIIY